MSRHRVERIVAVGVLALAGCGGGGGSSSGDSEDELSPLAELMGWTPVEPAEQRRQDLEREQHVAECMRAEGWEYEPVDWQAQMPVDEDAEIYEDPEAFGAKHGYGVAHTYERYERDGGRAASTEFEDPNEEYVSSLSARENEEYYATLHGDPGIWEDTGGEDGSFVSPPLEEQGCQGRAELAVFGDSPMNDPDIQQRMDDFWMDQQDDPRMEAAHAAWAECMGDDIEGLEVGLQPVSRPDQMYQVFESRKHVLMGLEEREIDPDDPSAYEGVYMSSGDGSGGPEIGWYGEPEEISDADLAALRDEEIAMWKLDWECQQDAGVRETSERIEQELVDELLAEFPDLADRAGERAGDS